MFKKLLSLCGLYHPFTHNPKDFKLRIIPASFDSNYVFFEYTANGGKKWKLIYCCNHPYLMDEFHQLRPLSARLGDGNFDRERQKFNSYQSILDYQKAENEKMIELNNRITQRLKNEILKQKEAYKRANK